MFPYIVSSILWGIFAAQQQSLRKGTKKSTIVLAFILNTAVMPVGLAIAILHNKNNTRLYKQQ